MSAKALRVSDSSATTVRVPEPLVRFGLGDVIRKLRGDETQKSLGERAGVDATAIIYLERAERQTDLQTLERIAAALSVTLADLFECVDQLKWVDALARLDRRHRTQVLALAARLAGESNPGSQQSTAAAADPPGEAAERSGTARKARKRR